MRSTLPTFNEVWQQQFRLGVLKQLSSFNDQTSVLIGCSGGMDSMLLLHLLHAIIPEKIRVIYINHQLQEVSDDWANFVFKQCQFLSIPCVIQTVKVDIGNLENQARQARYQAYQQHLKSEDVLALGHHQQDQAETLMLRLLSGAGVSGLSAMKAIDIRESSIIWRPLLDISREQICQWVDQLNIQYIDDPTNFDTHYDRAWCRHELWHILQSRYPKMQQSLARTSYLMQDADAILEQVLQEDLSFCGNSDSLDLLKFQQLSSARQRQLLSSWMKGQDLYRPSFEMVERIQNEVIHSKVDAQAALHWNQYYYVRYQQMLYRLQKQVYLAEKNVALEQKNHAEQKINFSLDQDIEVISGHFKIQTEEIGLSFALLNQSLSLNIRLGGEKIHLYGRVGHWPLKKAIQQAHIFPWLRHTIQILSIDNVMLGVFTPKGFWLAQSKYCEVGGWQPKLIAPL